MRKKKEVSTIRKVLKENIDDLIVDGYVDVKSTYEKIVKARNILEENSSIDY